jgi:hypothetical protein
LVVTITIVIVYLLPRIAELDETKDGVRVLGNVTGSTVCWAGRAIFKSR